LDVYAINTNAGQPSSKFGSSQVNDWQPWYDILDSDDSVPVCPDLAWNAVLPSSTPRHIDNDLSTLPYYDLDDDYDSVIEPSVDFIANERVTTPNLIDPTSKYLYALDLHLFETNSDRMQFYADPLPINEHILQAHMDAGSMMNTTNHVDYLWDFKPLQNVTTTLRVADDTPHHPIGIGFLKVPTHGSPDYLLVQTFYTPTLPATILSPASITTATGCQSYTSFANLNGRDCYLTLHGYSDNPDITFPLQFRNGLLFTRDLLSPSSTVSPELHTTCSPCSVAPASICQLSRQQLSHLWHQRLGHINRRTVAEMHRYATGIPKIPTPSKIDNCPICLSSKLH